MIRARVVADRGACLARVEAPALAMLAQAVADALAVASVLNVALTKLQ